jgi:hypothetical protein
VLASLVLSACGSQPSTGAPPTNQPISGTGTYSKIDGTYVVSAAVNLSDPAVVASSTAGPFALWFTYADNEIRRSDLPTLKGTATSPRPALTATEPWEGGSVAAPALERTQSGYRMVYEAAGGVLGQATSSDGEQWSNKQQIGMGHHPSIAGGSLYYDTGGQIFRDGIALFSGASPDVHVFTTFADRMQWLIFYECPATMSVSICAAGSFDGTHFTLGTTPLLPAVAPDERGPAAVLGGTSAVMFFWQLAGASPRIGAATTP